MTAPADKVPGADKLRAGLAKLRWKDISPADMAEVLGDLILEAVRPIADRIAALEAAESQKTFKGVYESGVAYRKHNIVAHGGSMWVATADPTGSPPGNGWTLGVKRGRDAR